MKHGQSMNTGAGESLADCAGQLPTLRRSLTSWFTIYRLIATKAIGVQLLIQTLHHRRHVMLRHVVASAWTRPTSRADRFRAVSAAASPIAVAASWIPPAAVHASPRYKLVKAKLRTNAGSAMANAS